MTRNSSAHLVERRGSTSARRAPARARRSRSRARSPRAAARRASACRGSRPGRCRARGRRARRAASLAHPRASRSSRTGAARGRARCSRRPRGSAAGRSPGRPCGCRARWASCGDARLHRRRRRGGARPASSGSAPVIALIRVDLPAPFSPMSEWTSPGNIRKSTASSAASAPKRTVATARARAAARGRPCGHYRSLRARSLSSTLRADDDHPLHAR